MPRVANIPRYALHVHNASRRNQALSDPHLCPKPQKKEAFANGELNKVVKILDGIAERTGFVYVVLNRRFAAVMFDVSEAIIKGTSETEKVLRQRMDKVECYVKSSGLGTEQKGGQE